ncbi:uncharacterized protein LOC125661515 [Ostrea edulis]|uniref:uncharacterized protein LOC125661515 n=1 Tax=Ostrea edulis TaxID=37623 RepID=UPI0024AFD3BB|nr:uncharacterized protein LOC125661515 [Ostrea edulis]
MSGEVMDAFNKYVALDNKIRLLENKNIRKTYDSMKKRYDKIVAEVKDLETKYADSKKNTAKEKADVDQLDIKSFLSKEAFDEKMDKEKAEYLEALNKEEVFKRQLEAIKPQVKEVEDNLKKEKIAMDELEKLCQEQESLLSEIFDGAYGSDLENKLESDLDLIREKRQRIGNAKYKWTNGRILLQHACNQMAQANKRWAELENRNLQMPQKYAIATEVRNNQIAAIQNLRSCQTYLDNIDFPYCKPTEVQTLEKATNNIYIDMQSADRHKHAGECYRTTHRRASALLQWFDNVINTVIEKDVLQATKEESEASRALRSERIRLLKEKVEGEGGQLDVGDSDLPADDDEDPEIQAVIFKAEGEEENSLKPGNNDVGPAPTPIPLNELAPIPSQEDLFGDIEQLKKQHEKEVSDFQKAQEMNKARLQQGLEAKLAARRNRRTKPTAE